MKLWIRSQDKDKFLICEDLRIDDILVRLSKTPYKKEIPNYMAIKFEIYERSTLLGRYDTKKRCLEIIDEIQELFMRSLVTLRNVSSQNPSIEYHEQSVVVYEMPKE